MTLASESILPHFAASNCPSAQLQRSSKRLRWRASHPKKPGNNLWNQGRKEACRTTMPISRAITVTSILHSTSVQLLSRLNLICVDPSLSSELSPHLKNCTVFSTYQVAQKKVESSHQKTSKKKRNEQTPFFRDFLRGRFGPYDFLGSGFQNQRYSQNVQYIYKSCPWRSRS